MGRHLMSLLLLGLLAVCSGDLQAGVKTTTLPTYSRNPLTGASTVSGGYYNPTTGRGASYSQSSNALTGRTRSNSTSYNNLTGNMTHRSATSNPMTGVSTRSTVWRR
jgi:hypothetical protein